MIVKCPHCSQKFEVDEQDIGAEATCSSCSKVFIVKAIDGPPQPRQRLLIPIAASIGGVIVIALGVFIGLHLYDSHKKSKLADEWKQHQQLSCLGDMKKAYDKALEMNDDLDAVPDGTAIGPTAMTKIVDGRIGCSAGPWTVFVPRNWEAVKELDSETVGEMPLFYCSAHKVIYWYGGSGNGYNRNFDLNPQKVLDISKIPETVKQNLSVK